MEYEADKRSYRVLKLFETLQKLGQGAALDRKEFAEEMGVSERSVQRDIRTINGFPTAETHRKSCTIGSGTDTGSIGKIPVSLIKGKYWPSAKFLSKAGHFRRQN